MAAVHDDILAMPMKYHTLIVAMGTVLSGGQKRRVLLARALPKWPKILLLDEATSHLDLSRETQVSEAIRHLRVTRVIVAHRPETIATADRVITLEPEASGTSAGRSHTLRAAHAGVRRSWTAGSQRLRASGHVQAARGAAV